MAKYFTKEGDDYKEVDAFSQPEVDEIVTKRLDRERGKFADYDELKEKAAKVETIKTEYEGKLKAAGTEKTELEKQLGSAKLETDKVKIVNEFKLSDDLAEFVTGNTADEMRQRAEKLSKGVKGGKLDLNKDPKPKDGEKTDSKAIAGKLFGGKSDD
jgi:hypothetical protein